MQFSIKELVLISNALYYYVLNTDASKNTDIEQLLNRLVNWLNEDADNDLI